MKKEGNAGKPSREWNPKHDPRVIGRQGRGIDTIYYVGNKSDLRAVQQEMRQSGVMVTDTAVELRPKNLGEPGEPQARRSEPLFDSVVNALRRAFTREIGHIYFDGPGRPVEATGSVPRRFPARSDGENVLQQPHPAALPTPRRVREIAGAGNHLQPEQVTPAHVPQRLEPTRSPLGSFGGRARSGSGETREQTGQPAGPRRQWPPAESPFPPGYFAKNNTTNGEKLPQAK